MTSSPLPEDAPVRYACACNHHSEYPRPDAFEELSYDTDTSDFTVNCPECRTERPANVLQGDFNGTELVCVVAGEYTDDVQRDDDSSIIRTEDTTDFSDAPSPFNLTKEMFIIRCESCHTLLDESQYQAGPRAPESGWEYYHCPDCGENTNAEVAEHTYA